MAVKTPEVLERVSAAAIRRATREAIAASLAEACAQAKADCPKDTGALAGSIGCRVSDDGGALFATAPHAMPVEMGTAHMPARPYLYPAFAAHKQRMASRIAQAVRALIRGEAV